MPDIQDIDTPIDIIEEDETPMVAEPTGFLPIQTNWFDRCFIGVVIWVAISLLWLRFLEPAGLSIWIGNAISLALAVYIVAKG
jgi:predicted small integral membrane protein